MAIFQNLIITGRPACGKSELIDFLKKVPAGERTEKYHIGNFKEEDDFPWLWRLSEEDNALEKQGKPRLYTRRVPEGFEITRPTLRGDFFDKMNDVILEKYLKNPSFYKENTLLIEFARGKGDGFKRSLEKLSPEVLKMSAILHILVSFKESFRKNDARYKKGLEGSILSHKVPDKDMNEYFIENDWLDITQNQPCGHLMLNGVNVPFLTVNNEPELIDPIALERRFMPALKKLWEIKNAKTGV